MKTIELSTQNQLPVASNSHWKDWLGITASVGCAIHCAAMPLVISYLPLLGLSFLADEAFHKWMAVACFLIAMMSFIPGLRRHGSWWPMGVGAVGLSLITVAAFTLEGQCCSACSDGTQEQVASAAVCNDCAQCEHCASQKTANESVANQSGSTQTNSTLGKSTQASAANSNNDSLANIQSVSASVVPISSAGLGWLIPWITPVGGLILVSSHLLNRHLGCSCDCCPSEQNPQGEA